MAFGIDTAIFPMDEDGNILKDRMTTYIEKRKKEEAKAKEKEAIEKEIYVPTCHDVLLGRGKPFQNHSGNLQMVKLIEARHHAYMQANRFQKTCLSWEIVKNVQSEYGGRFLEKDEATDTWKIVSDDIARENAASGFRSIKKLRAMPSCDISGLAIDARGDKDGNKRAKLR